MLADDADFVRSAVRRLLEEEPKIQLLGEAVNFPQTLQMAADLKPNVVLLDLHMPGISGIELLRLLRSRGMTRPIFVISGRRDPIQDEALAAGASALLSKPFDDQQLLDLVAQALSA